MKAYVINLERALTRRAYMAQEFNKLGIDWTFLTATDAGDILPAERAAFIARRQHHAPVHPWNPGQIGALLSHMEAWRRIGDGADAWGAVFEDDVHVDPRLAAFLQDDHWVPDDADLIRFETTRQGMRLGRALALSPGVGFKLRPVLREAWGAAAYVISRDTARWLACTPARLQAPADYLLFHKPSTLARHLTILQFDPAPCIQDQFLPDGFPEPAFCRRPRPRRGRRSAAHRPCVSALRRWAAAGSASGRFPTRLQNDDRPPSRIIPPTGDRGA